MSNPSLPGLIYDWAERWPQKEYNGIISPSSLGGCMRSHWLKIKGHAPTTPPGPGALLNFELGRMWETPVEKALLHARVPFISQLYLKDKTYGVGGTIDVALFDREEDDWELISIKTEGLMKGKYRAKDGQTFIESNPEYAIQEGVYRYLMLANGYKVKPTCRYLVITKDNGWIEEHEMEFTDEVTNDVLDRLKLLRGFLDLDIMPPCECQGWRIQYCGFGNPVTQEKNKSGKLVNTECCLRWDGA